MSSKAVLSVPDATMAGYQYLSDFEHGVIILSDRLHPFMAVVQSDGLSSRAMRQSARRDLLPSGSRNTLLTMGTSVGHINPQTRTLLSISGMPCNVLFKRDRHLLALLWICGLSRRIHGVKCLQDTFSH